MSLAPPHDLAAERATLGAFLLDNTALGRVSLEPEYFYDARHRTIFRAMRRMVEQGIPVDERTLYNEVKQDTEQPLGSYISELADCTPSAANVGAYAEIVQDKAGARSLIALTADISQRAQAGESVALLRESLLQHTANLADLCQDAGAQPFDVISWATLKRSPPEKRDYVVDGLLQKGWLSLLLGDPKIGKSVLIRTLIWAAICGESWLGRAVRKGRVLFLSLEEGSGDVKRYFEQMALPETDRLTIVFGRPPRDRIPWLTRIVADTQPDLIVIDILARFLSFREIYDYGKALQDMGPLVEIARQSNVHILACHHARKSGGQYGHESMGSQAIYAAADLRLTITREGQQRHIISDGRDHQKIVEPLALHLDEETGRITVVGTEKELDTQKVAAAALAALEKADEPLTLETIRKELGVQKKRVHDALMALIEDGKIEREKVGRAYVYRYPRTENCSHTVPEGREQLKPHYSEELGLKTRTVPSPIYNGNGNSS